MQVKLIEESDSLLKYEVHGKLTFEDFRGDNNPLEELGGKDWCNRKVLVNLSKISFMDSTAVGWLLTCNKQCKDAGGRLVLHSTPPFVAQVFNMLKMGKTLSIAIDEQAGLAMPLVDPKATDHHKP